MGYLLRLRLPHQERSNPIPSQIVAIHSICDDILKSLNHCEDKQRPMSNAEMMTTSIMSALFIRGNMEKSRVFLQEHYYVPKLLSEGQTPGFSYPNGQSTCDAKRILHDLDFESACARPQDVVRPGCDICEIPRFCQRDVDGGTFLQALHLWTKSRGA